MENALPSHLVKIDEIYFSILSKLRNYSIFNFCKMFRKAFILNQKNSFTHKSGIMMIMARN